MTDANNDRLRKLEELCAHHSAELETLSDTVREQWQEIDRLRKALMQLRDRLLEVEDNAGAPEITKPPHY